MHANIIAGMIEKYQLLILTYLRNHLQGYFLIDKRLVRVSGRYKVFVACGLQNPEGWFVSFPPIFYICISDQNI